MDSGAIAANGRFVIKVGDLYAAAGVAAGMIKDTYVVGAESLDDRLVLQLKTGGGATQIPQRKEGGASGCE